MMKGHEQHDFLGNTWVIKLSVFEKSKVEFASSHLFTVFVHGKSQGKP